MKFGTFPIYLMGSGIFTDQYHFAKIYRLQPDCQTNGNDIFGLVNDLDQNTSLTFYTILVGGEVFSFLALKDSRPLNRQRWLSARSYEKHLLTHHRQQTEHLDSIAARYPHVSRQSVNGKDLECFLGYIFYSDLQRTENFTLDKDLRINTNGEITLLSRKDDLDFSPLKFYMISILDAPYSNEFWKSLCSYSGDFTCAVSLQRIDEQFANKVLKRTRSLYHARKNAGSFPKIDHLFHYSTLLLYPCENYLELQQFITHLRTLGCNVQVQSANAEECLANFLPPGNVYGEAATVSPENLFPHFIKTRKQTQKKSLVCNRPVSLSIPAKALARNETLHKFWPLVSYDPDSGFLITENHEFTRVYAIENYWDPHIAAINYPVFDRAVNQLCTDPAIRMSFYLHREQLGLSEATNALMHEQMVHLRDQRLAFKTKGFLTLTYTHPERSLQTLKSMTHEEAWDVVQQKVDEAQKRIKIIEDGFQMIAYDPLKDDRLLEFFNPLLNSKVQSLTHFLQGPTERSLLIRIFVGHRYYHR